MDTMHRELEWFDGEEEVLQRILADRVTVDSAVRLRETKVVRLKTGKNLYAFFTEGGKQVETLNVGAVRTVSELDELLDEIVEEVRLAEEAEEERGRA